MADGSAREVTLRALGEHDGLGDQVGARLEFESSSPSRRPCRPAHSHRAAVVDEQLGRRGLAEDVDARLLRLVGQPAAELYDRGDVIAVVAGGRRRRRAGSRASSSAAGRPRPCRPSRRSAIRSRRRSGNSLRIADGFIIAPDSRCEPGPFPFSTTATRTSPSDSISCSSSASSCVSQIAQASPASPPPTIATPTSIRSSSGSVGAPTNSLAESTGGRNSIGAVLIRCSLAPLGLNRLGQLGHDLVEVANDAEVRELENRRVRVLVDRDDVLRDCMPTLCWIAPEMPAAT